MKRKLGSFHPDDFGAKEGTTPSRKKSKKKEKRSQPSTEFSTSSSLDSTHFDLAAALKNSDYSGDESLQVYVPDIVPPNLDRLRIRLSAGLNPLPVGATICALIDHGLEHLFNHSVVQSFLRLGRLVLEDDGLDEPTMVALYHDLHNWAFQVPSLFSMSRLHFRCPDFWKSNVTGKSHQLGLRRSTLSCTCLMWAMGGQKQTRPGHKDLLTKPLRHLVEQMELRIVRAERLLQATKGRVL